MNDHTEELFSVGGELVLESSVTRARKLFVEGLALSAVAFAVASLLGFEQSGIFAIFLTAAAFTHRLDGLLTENRDNIWSTRVSPWKANRLTAISVLSIFLATTVVFAAAAGFFERQEIYQSFAFVLEAAGFDAKVELHRRFPSILGIIGHNMTVLVTVVALGFIYRSYGALLALVWNASVWGVVITLLLKDAYAKTDVSVVAYVAASLTAFLPHLVLEAFSYILAALAAIFVSRGITKYDLKDERMKKVSQASGLMIFIAALVLMLAGLVEGTVAPYMLSTIR